MEWLCSIPIGFFFLFTILALASTLQELRRIYQTRRWPSVIGIIRDIQLNRMEDEESNSFEVIVEYTYRINDEEFTGNRIAIGYHPDGVQAYHTTLFQTMKETQEIDVWYNPHRPEISYLSHSIHPQFRTKLFFSVSCFLFTTMFLCAIWLSNQPDMTLVDNINVK
jgi:hypothetical protein